MINVPDQVWLWMPSIDEMGSAVHREELGEGCDMPCFVRCAPDVLAALPEVQALIAEAVKKATSA